MAITRVSYHPQADEATRDELLAALANAGETEEASYPSRLYRMRQDAPPFTIWLGGQSLLERPAVGFTGARDASPEGLATAALIAGYLARLGWVVVSGHARGVDQAAHRAALEAGGSTLYVPVEGIARFHPRSALRRLHEDGNWGVLSISWPAAGWKVHSAMRRNRVIAALSDLVVAIEPRDTGGTLHAAMTALDLDTPLWLLPRAEPTSDAEARLAEAATLLPRDLHQREDGEDWLGERLLSTTSAGELDALGQAILAELGPTDQLALKI